jgi:hypothetical protein
MTLNREYSSLPTSDGGEVAVTSTGTSQVQRNPAFSAEKPYLFVALYTSPAKCEEKISHDAQGMKIDSEGEPFYLLCWMVTVREQERRGEQTSP